MDNEPERKSTPEMLSLLKPVALAQGVLGRNHYFHLDYFYITEDFVLFAPLMTHLHSRNSHKTLRFLTAAFPKGEEIIVKPCGKFDDLFVQDVLVVKYNSIAMDNLDPEANSVLMFYKFRKF